MAVKRREAKGKGEKERYTNLVQNWALSGRHVSGWTWEDSEGAGGQVQPRILLLLLAELAGSAGAESPWNGLQL